MLDEHSSVSGGPQELGEVDRRQNQGNILFVGNLPFQTPWQHVKDHFRNAGKVRYTDLIADRMGRPKGSALVTMANPDGAQRAIRMYNETDFEGRRLIVRLFDDGPRPPLVQRDMMPQYDRQAQHQAQHQHQHHQLHHHQHHQHQHHPLHLQVQHPQMHHHQHHQHQHHQLHQQVQHQHQQRFRGYTSTPPNNSSYNTMNSYGRVAPAGGYSNTNNNNNNNNNALRGSYLMGEDANTTSLNDMNEVVPKPRSKQVNEVGRKLFVSNLPFDCTSSALRETFQQVGDVERAEIIMGRNGKSRGMGIVVMKTEEEARLAIAEFDGIEMANRAMNVRLDNKPTS